LTVWVAPGVTVLPLFFQAAESSSRPYGLASGGHSRYTDPPPAPLHLRPRPLPIHSNKSTHKRSRISVPVYTLIPAHPSFPASDSSRIPRHQTPARARVQTMRAASTPSSPTSPARTQALATPPSLVIRASLHTRSHDPKLSQRAGVAGSSTRWRGSWAVLLSDSLLAPKWLLQDLLFRARAHFLFILVFASVVYRSRRVLCSPVFPDFS